VTLEEWKTFEVNYQVSNLGRIRSVFGNRVRVLKVFPKPKYIGKVVRGKNYYVHTLVLENFVGHRPTGCEARHKDGDLTNNCVDNLEWGSRSENAHDKKRHGTCGSIPVRRSDGVVYRSLADAAYQNGTTTGKISAVCKGKRKREANRRWEYV